LWSIWSLLVAGLVAAPSSLQLVVVEVVEVVFLLDMWVLQPGLLIQLLLVLVA
jgi:hypothetical protein